jgi:hypothetical protein
LCMTIWTASVHNCVLIAISLAVHDTTMLDHYRNGKDAC